MTAPLRRVHLRIWTTLAVVLALLIAAALFQRENTMPVNDLRWERLR